MEPVPFLLQLSVYQCTNEISCMFKPIKYKFPKSFNSLLVCQFVNWYWTKYFSSSPIDNFLRLSCIPHLNNSLCTWKASHGLIRSYFDFLDQITAIQRSIFIRVLLSMDTWTHGKCCLLKFTHTIYSFFWVVMTIKTVIACIDAH